MVYGNFDAPYFILNSVLPKPERRNITTIIWSFSFRFIIDILFAVEFSRIATFLLCFLCIFMHRTLLMFTNLLTGCKEFSRFYYYYIAYCLNIRRIEACVHNLIYITLAGIFWAVVACMWMCVKRSVEQLTLVLYIFFVITLTLLLAAHIVLIPLICQMTENVLYALKFHRLRTKPVFCKRKSCPEKVKFLQAYSLFSFRLRYGSFWCLNRELVADYLQMLMLRCLEVLLVFD